MKQPKTLLLAVASTAILGGVFLAPSESRGQQPAPPAVPAQPAPQANPEGVAIATLIGELELQQNQIAANQEAIEKKLATIEESLRVAKIYVSRGGGKLSPAK